MVCQTWRFCYIPHHCSTQKAPCLTQGLKTTAKKSKSSCSSGASKEHPKRVKQRMKWKYDEDSCNSSDSCEPKPTRRISWAQSARSSRRKGNRRRKKSQEKPLNVSPTEKATYAACYRIIIFLFPAYSP